MTTTEKSILYLLLFLLYAAIIFGVYLFVFGRQNPYSIPKKQPQTLSGQVVKRFPVDSPFASCDTASNDDYLVSGTKAIRLIYSNTAYQIIPAYSRVEATGKLDKTACSTVTTACACSDFMVVDSVNIITDGKTLGKEYTGMITCKDAGVDDDGTKLCGYRFTFDPVPPELTDASPGATLFVGLPGSGVIRDFVGARVRVLGILGRGILEAFEISRLQ